MIQIGFMQGRLSPLVNGMIQAFPWENWEKEFEIAGANDFNMMEWTLDQKDLYQNPLMTKEGQAQIKKLSSTFDVEIPSLTGDCFMQAPFWKSNGQEQFDLQNDFCAILDACITVGIETVVIPLVDNGSLDDEEQENVLVSYLQTKQEFFRTNNIKIVFESDLNPSELARFIARLDKNVFGVNYDIGNSAALGYDPQAEILAYGQRIYNVHVKDRPLNGTTVPLGEGNADFGTVFAELHRIGYKGNYILQTARANDDNHLGALLQYRKKVSDWVASCV